MNATDAANARRTSPDSAAGRGAGDHRDERLSPLSVGVVVWLASEVMFFGGLFAAWFVLKSQNINNWPPEGQELDATRMGFFTAVLVSSSVSMHFALDAAERGRRRAVVQWLAVTIALGAAFLVHEVVEWSELPFGFDASSYSSIFYMLTGFHGAHVLGGIGLMMVVAWMVSASGSRIPIGQTVRATSYYWHFVDVVWVFLYITVYVLA